MKIEKNALTLVELLISITISMLIMVSIWVFTSSWLSNLFLQEKSIWNIFYINDFIKETKNAFDFMDSKSKILTNGIIFKRKTEYEKWWFSYIWTLEKNDFCKNWEKTKHIFIKNFIIKSPISWEFKIRENQVFQNGNLILWKKFFWKDFSPWDLWENVPLNNPSSVVKDKNWFIFVSDTLNNRILLINKDKKVYNFLWEEILKEPISLKFENQKLKITNAWKWEILEYKTDKKEYFDKKFSWEKENIFFDKIAINITKKFSKIYNNFDFSEEEKLNDFFDLNNFNLNDFDVEIDPNLYVKYSQKIKWKEKIFFKTKQEYLTSKWGKKVFLWEIQRKIYLKPKNFENFYSFVEDSEVINFSQNNFKINAWNKNIFVQKSGENYDFFLKKDIEIEKDWKKIKEEKYFKLRDFKMIFDFDLDFSWKINFSELSWKYFVNLEFLDNKLSSVFEIKEEKIYENDLENIEITQKNLKYPYDFWKDFDLENPWNFIDFDEENDKILNLPIKSLEISKDWDFLNFILKYYRNYDCENPDLNEQKISTLFLKNKIK